jgi:hypothetical protein
MLGLEFFIFRLMDHFLKPVIICNSIKIPCLIFEKLNPLLFPISNFFVGDAYRDQAFDLDVEFVARLPILHHVVPWHEFLVVEGLDQLLKILVFYVSVIEELEFLEMLC